MTSPDIDFYRQLAARGALPGNHTSPEAAAAAVSIGAEMKLPPMFSLRTIAVSGGRVTIQAQAQLAAALKVCPNLQWDITESTAETCTVIMTRGGEHPKVSTTFDMADAKRAGLNGSTTWKKYPSDMLFARCITRALRRIVPEAGGHDPDEINPQTVANIEYGPGRDPALAPAPVTLDSLIPKG